MNIKRKRYNVKGGLPGVEWGQLYSKHISNQQDINLIGDDLELCAFVSHDKTGCSCALYRSLEKKLIAVSFRGTCEPVDLLTDANIIQTPWVEGMEVKEEGVPMVHVGFRNSLNSISQRLKQLILAAVAPSESLSQYDLLVTGHSLGGALATLFTADVAEFGMDAGRSLPQLAKSDPWWNSLSTLFSKPDSSKNKPPPEPPQPKSLRVYTFGSPRVGNIEFVSKFRSLLNDGSINQAYRMVNNADIVARLPRTINTLVLGTVGYDHCGATALISSPKATEFQENKSKDSDKHDIDDKATPLIWVEGESNSDECPVRDGTPLTNPLASGALLGDLLESVKNVTSESPAIKLDPNTVNKSLTLSLASDYVKNLGSIASKITDTVSDRLQSVSVSDITSVVGIKKDYAEREFNLVQSVVNGQGLAHHMEDEYYQAMGRACGFIALVGKEIQSIQEIESRLEKGEEVDFLTPIKGLE